VTQQIKVLAAETEAGRRALAEVMQRSYSGRLEGIPPPWARVRLADGVPVAFILVDPDRRMEFPTGDLRYAFITDVATREDRRGEGHFRGIMEDTFAALRAAGIALVITHGCYPLYRRSGFTVFTHHCGIFIAPTQIERHLGAVAAAPEGEGRLVVEEQQGFQEDLLLVADVRASSLSECRAALQAAAAAARKRGKSRILFEHPAAPSYGSRYPIYPSPETPFTALARACGAQVCLQGADPESGTIPDADWIKVLDAAALVQEALACSPLPERPLTLESTGERVTALAGVRPAVERARWPAAALAQLVTGYRSAERLAVLHGISLSPEALALLGALFPPGWRFSRNESWTYHQ